MVAFKTGTPLRRVLDAFDAACPAALVYGPDAGLVAERAAALARHLAGQTAGEMVWLDERDLAEDPARLEVELRTVPMFAERKVVRVAAGPRLDVPSLKALLAGPLQNAVVVEAAALRPDSALRKLFESHRAAIALACYGDERSLSDAIDEELGRAGLRIAPDVRAYLASRLGADQALSRSELAKLSVFAAGRDEITADDVDAVVGDSAEIAVEDFIYEVSAGETRAALRQLSRLGAAGTDISVALAALGRHYLQLHRVAASGASPEQAMRSLRPRPHFKRERAFVAHCKRLGPQRLLSALPLIQAAVRNARLNPELGRAFAERLVLSLTRRAESGTPQTR